MAKAKVTKKELIADLKHLCDKHSDVSRDFYRRNGKFGGDAWNELFPSWDAFKEAAGVAAKAKPSRTLSVEERIEAQKAKRDPKWRALEEEKKFLLERNEMLEERVNAALEIAESDATPCLIEPKLPSGASESAAVFICSDWHNEEEVLSEKVNGRNEHNLEVFHNRAVRSFQGAQRLWFLMNKDTAIRTMVVGLLGDFISGNLHGDQQESNLLGPTMAIENAQREIVSGLKFLLDNTDIEEFVVVCKSGNHARITQKQRHNTEAENSLEYLMYCNLRMLFRDEARVKFVVEPSYLSHIVLFDSYTMRFHHGHNIKYGGGVGGVYIPVNKKIANWNTCTSPSIPPVRLDVFGHFHQYIDAGNFVANGSLIGYNSYAVSIGAPYEPPQQAFFLINKRYNNKTMATPIFAEG
jgi:hypothetical protein